MSASLNEILEKHETIKIMSLKVNWSPFHIFGLEIFYQKLNCSNSCIHSYLIRDIGAKDYEESEIKLDLDEDVIQVIRI